jgi:hypothetical protein
MTLLRGSKQSVGVQTHPRRFATATFPGPLFNSLQIRCLLTARVGARVAMALLA